MHGTSHACIPFIEYVYALKMLGYYDISDLHTPCVLFFKQDTEKGGHQSVYVFIKTVIGYN